LPVDPLPHYLANGAPKSRSRHLKNTPVASPGWHEWG
jgi:hypothetical protein